MTYLVQFVVCFIAGIGAGLGTGFAGMSAAAVISPMLITFLGMDPYLAVGIALASDVLASAVSAYTYKKNGNLDVKNGAVMMAAVLLLGGGGFSGGQTLGILSAASAAGSAQRASTGAAGAGFVGMKCIVLHIIPLFCWNSRAIRIVYPTVRHLPRAFSWVFPLSAW